MTDLTLLREDEREIVHMFQSTANKMLGGTTHMYCESALRILSRLLEARQEIERLRKIEDAAKRVIQSDAGKEGGHDSPAILTLWELLFPQADQRDERTALTTPKKGQKK